MTCRRFSFSLTHKKLSTRDKKENFRNSVDYLAMSSESATEIF
jgi:hypothetical protein